jgi:hypothetical protein
MFRLQLVDLVGRQGHDLGVHGLLVQSGLLHWWLRLHRRGLCVWLGLRRGCLRWVYGVVGRRPGDWRRLLHERRLRDWGRRGGCCLDKRAEYLRVHKLQEK